MTLELLIWLLVIFVQTAQLGVTMYTLICLSDLENDFINPHDASERINKCIVPELCLSVALAILYAGGQSLLFLAIPVGLCGWMVRDYVRGGAFVDVTEIFRSTAKEKKKRLIRLGFHFLLFIFSIFKLVTTIVYTVLPENGFRVSNLMQLLLDSWHEA